MRSISSEKGLVDSDMSLSPQIPSQQSTVIKYTNKHENYHQHLIYKRNYSKIERSNKSGRPLITIPKFATISKLEFNQFNLPRDYRALKLETRRENIVFSHVDAFSLKDANNKCHNNHEMHSKILADDSKKFRNNSCFTFEMTTSTCKINESIKEFGHGRNTQTDVRNRATIDPSANEISNTTSEDIFDIEDKEFEARVDINQIVKHEMILESKDYFSPSSPPIDKLKKDHVILSHESTVVESDKRDNDTDSQQIFANPQAKNSNLGMTLLEYPCKLESWAPLQNDSTCPRRLFFNRVKNKKYISCVVTEHEVIFYLQGNTNWVILGKVKRLENEKECFTANTVVLLTSLSGASNHLTCLKSIVVSKKDSLATIHDYSYWCSFNFETNDVFALSSRKDEIHKER